MGWQDTTFSLLIVNAAAGGFSGLFVYAPSPGAGNLIASVAAAAGTDPYGNAYRKGVTSYGAAESYVNLLNNQVAIGTSAADQGGKITGGGGQINYSSGTGPPGDINAALVLISKALTISGNNPQALIGPTQFPTSVTSEMLEVQGNIAVGGIVIPVLGGAEETWHPFTLLAGTTAGNDINGTSYPPAYKMLPDGNVALRGVLVTPGGGLPAGTTWATIPAAYRPATNIPVALISNALAGTFCHVYIRPNGNVQFDAAIGAAFNMDLDCILNVNGT